MTKEFIRDQLQVKIYDSRAAMGEAAAEAFIKILKTRLKYQDYVRTIFAAAPSQLDFLQHLLQEQHLDWRRVIAFHMDEYLDLPLGSQASFGHFLEKHLFDQLPFGQIHYIDPRHEDPLEECRYYTQLLKEDPIDVVAMGIGENGHIAFNDPPVADFQDPDWVKVVELDAICRQQQVNDGAFPDLATVPTHAITLTVPALIGADHIVCVVPGVTKQGAVKNTLEGPIATSCPASILRQHQAATLFLDAEAAKLIEH